MTKPNTRKEDRETGKTFRPTDEEMQTLTLGSLAPDQVIEITRGKVKITTTPRELMRPGRMPAFLTLAEVEFAFSTDDAPKATGAVVSIWKNRLPRGRF